jgi:hypothetical protein
MFTNGAGDGELNEEERQKNEDGIKDEYSLKDPAVHAVST